MERKECVNGLQLIRVACIKLKGHFSALFMGALAMTTPLILDMFLGILCSIFLGNWWCFTVALMLFVIFVAPLQMGYIKYFNDVLDGKQPKMSQVFCYVRFSFMTLRSIYISGILMVMYILGGVLWLVPAGCAVSAFSMVLFFLQKYEYPKLRTAMWDCAKKMMGNRLAMFAYKLIFYIVYIMLFAIAALCLALIYNLFLENFFVSWIVAMCSAIVFIFMYTFVTVYFHSSNQIFFEDVISRDEKKRATKVKTTANNTDQVGNNTPVEKVEEEKVEVVETEEKADKKEVKETTSEEKKTTTKKASTAKSATSVIYRFFEALGEDIDSSKAYDLFALIYSLPLKKEVWRVCQYSCPSAQKKSN